jgi:hypothetical protein
MIASHGSGGLGGDGGDGGLGGDGAVAAWDGGSLGGDGAAAWRLRRRRSPSPRPLCSLLAHGHIARGASRSSSPVIHVSPSRSSSRSSSTAAWRLHRCRIPSPHPLCSLLAHGHVARGASRSSLVVHASPSRSSSRSSSTTAWRLHQRRSPSPHPLCSLLAHGHIARAPGRRRLPRRAPGCHPHVETPPRPYPPPGFPRRASFLWRASPPGLDSSIVDAVGDEA